MQIYDSFFFVGLGDSPDDREVKWTPGHVDKDEFSVAAGCAVTVVKHAWADDDNTDPAQDGPAFWAEEQTREYPHPITFCFA